MIKYIHIFLLSLATLGVISGSFQFPSVEFVDQSSSEISDLEDEEHSLFFFLFENDNSEEQSDSEDSTDLDPQEEENKRGIESDLDRTIPFTGISNTQVKSNLKAQLNQTQPTKRYILFSTFKIYC